VAHCIHPSRKARVQVRFMSDEHLNVWNIPLREVSAWVVAENKCTNVVPVVAKESNAFALFRRSLYIDAICKTPATPLPSLTTTGSQFVLLLIAGRRRSTRPRSVHISMEVIAAGMNRWMGDRRQMYWGKKSQEVRRDGESGTNMLAGLR